MSLLNTLWRVDSDSKRLLHFLSWLNRQVNGRVGSGIPKPHPPVLPAHIYVTNYGSFSNQLAFKTRNPTGALVDSWICPSSTPICVTQHPLLRVEDPFHGLLVVTHTFTIPTLPKLLFPEQFLESLGWQPLSGLFTCISENVFCTPTWVT